jgi:hypothetical protein
MPDDDFVSLAADLRQPESPSKHQRGVNRWVARPKKNLILCQRAGGGPSRSILERCFVGVLEQLTSSKHRSADFVFRGLLPAMIEHASES